MSQQPMDLVLVGYRPDDTNAAIRFCEQVFNNNLVRRRLLVLNRAGLSNEIAMPARGWEAVEGTNAFAEFSGWQEGLNHLAPVDRGVVFLNDTVTTHRRYTRTRRFATSRAMRCAPEGAMVGFIDAGVGVFSIDGLPVQNWISTYCFMLTRDALQKLDGKLFDPDLVARLVPGGLDEASFFSGLSRDLEHRLRHELFDGGWYGGARLTAANRSRLTLKGRCIVAELMLSARCDVLGVTRIDPLQRYAWAGRLDRFQSRLLHAVRKRIGKLSDVRGFDGVTRLYKE